MKSVFFILLAYCFQLQSQENSNFKIQNGDLIWQKVYETELSEEEIVDHLRMSGVFELTSSIKYGVTGRIFGLDADYKKLGVSYLRSPSYITDYSIESFIIAEFKEKRCRITIKNIKLVSNRINVESLSPSVCNLETYALKKLNSKFRDTFLDMPAKILNVTFDNLMILEHLQDKNW